MAFFSIEKRLRSDGTARYRCTVAVKQNGKYLHRENKTFSKNTLAKSWGAKRVAYIEEHGLPEPEKEMKEISVITVGDLLTQYENHPNITLGASKRSSLRTLGRSFLAEIKLTDLTAKHIIEHCQTRKAQGLAPSTISQDVSYLSVALEAAKPLFGAPANLNELSDAKVWLRNMGITGPSQRRSRRASATEVDRLYEVLKVKAETAYTGAPLHQIFMFSILTCMRVGEVCRLLWEDVDDIQRSVIVRDRKDPRKKIGNHMLVPLLGDAWRILTMQPRVEDRVFPFNPKSITAMYRRVRDELGIEDLRYHDLRREGASRLFEAGFSIEEVAQVTGHRSLNILWQVYTELFPKTLHEKFDKLQKSKNIE
ncbi:MULTISPECIES: tyrosine-type recombinase/integrase [Klebsiella pneumoniae complex]|uniref:tyrosine-type recombinase/integrase n=1 Tax=Klebsiella pneumoniae complex TaxID=3390273 RepID=UPI0019110671|nr:site-specific integrase [Klebsiella quasipneumoniae]EKW4786526.1 site-specific integrase [Klebsiella variicola]HBQ0451585.1 site-specific integrase [Klebsiella pneumoniae]HBR1665839.1 site-specific integrase [Klebsiella quasipneumoniae subsp. quasipneumoniae]MDZ3016128.1 site-specific integrase [Klebsiella quasipneumoniae]HCB0013974.1 site-specific integrase [Klebsiella pneumoniae]